MTEHPDVERARRGYEAFAKGDLATLTELLASDAVWHVQAGRPLDGDYHGRDQVFGFLGRLAGETGGTFRLNVHDVLANDEHTAVLATLTATRGANRSRSRWRTSPTTVTARSPSSGRPSPTQRRLSPSGPDPAVGGAGPVHVHGTGGERLPPCH
jgi:uncharacterized protein